MAHKDKLPQNPGLLFERFAPDISISADVKKEALMQITKAAQRADQKLLEALNQRWEEVAKAIHAQPFSLKTEWRLISGLGRKGPLEVGFTFNRYGFPVLPGSSLKGIARAWSFYQLAKALNASDLGKLDDLLSIDEDGKFLKEFQQSFSSCGQELLNQATQFRTVFGTTAKAGGAVFLDAFPTRLPQLDVDIMNPHYTDYYQGKDFPTNWQSPVPVYFLTVAANTEFRFAVGWRGEQNESLRLLGESWLIQGLTELGAGSKTSAGYGYFIHQISPPSTQTASSSKVESVSSQAADGGDIYTSMGKVKYENGKPFIVDVQDPTIIVRVDWASLRMNALPAKTSVKYNYRINPDGSRKIISMEKTLGA
ncbi:MAG: type III-B CRISPR module RAMP protein Cmr6 [Anaerolineales bacterium]|nr:type III-B CRISPR module RAMP protein Cmr6 [Anaerolineales bacterium]